MTTTISRDISYRALFSFSCEWDARPDVVPLTRVNHEQLDSSVSSVFAFNVTGENRQLCVSSEERQVAVWSALLTPRASMWKNAQSRRNDSRFCETPNNFTCVFYRNAQLLQVCSSVLTATTEQSAHSMTFIAWTSKKSITRVAMVIWE